MINKKPRFFLAKGVTSRNHCIPIFKVSLLPLFPISISIILVFFKDSTVNSPKLKCLQLGHQSAQELHNSEADKVWTKSLSPWGHRHSLVLKSCIFSGWIHPSVHFLSLDHSSFLCFVNGNGSIFFCENSKQQQGFHMIPHHKIKGLGIH